MEKELQNYAIDPMPVRGRVLEEFNEWIEEKAKDARSPKGFFAKLREELGGMFFCIQAYFLVDNFLYNSYDMYDEYVAISYLIDFGRRTNCIPTDH